MRPSERADSGRDADKFDVLCGTPFLITPYRYQKSLAIAVVCFL
jgi:hypothetical protein